MKAYISTKKSGGHFKSGLSIYTNNGVLIDAFEGYISTAVNKFDAPLEAVIWGLSKLNTLSLNGKISGDEKIILFTTYKTILSWLEKGVAPEPYTSRFGDLLFESHCLLNPTECVAVSSVDKKVKFAKKEPIKEEKLTAFFSTFE